ncbi:uncharacterized protein CDAR_572841 [Caerostris darwini]|uniref:Uncharacterized protein n=1 Tax=Caerostris darwini TaxID=1538125 RepID=A0AAV4W790_9ARAC|nr:uncharacterized protein CDAR_572841 [Caerostris darwini]
MAEEEKPEDTSNQDDDKLVVIPDKSKEAEGSSDTFEDSSPSEAEEEKMDERLLRHIFVRPRYAEPRHPILSSPYARHISMESFGPKKPKWFHVPSTEQLYLFKDIINHVEVGRENYFQFNDFMDVLQDFDPSITRTEVLEVLETKSIGKKLLVTSRQSLILSAIAYYVLIASPEDIQRYYIQNTRRKATVLHHHLEETRLYGLTGRQMEIKQLNAAKNLGPLYYYTGSPYALPVPFVPRFTQAKMYKEWKKQKLNKPRSVLPFIKRPVPRPIMPFKIHRQLGERVTFATKWDKLASQMVHGKIPLPEMRFPKDKLDRMKTEGYTVEMKDCMMEKAEEALTKFRQTLKEASVINARKNLKSLLRADFPTLSERDRFIEVYQRYLPIDVRDVKNYSLWVRPAGYQEALTNKPLYTDRFAFGSKLL